MTMTYMFIKVPKAKEQFMKNWLESQKGQWAVPKLSDEEGKEHEEKVMVVENWEGGWGEMGHFFGKDSSLMLFYVHCSSVPRWLKKLKEIDSECEALFTWCSGLSF